MGKIKRDTNEDLMNNVLELVKQNHCYDKAEKIMDYFHMSSGNAIKLTDYMFDLNTNLEFGTNEGIYRLSDRKCNLC